VRRHDVAAKALRDQPRQISAVVDVRVGQKDLVDGGRPQCKRLPVPLPQLLESLKQTTVDQGCSPIV
jgi:hypothetical protein